MEAISLEFYLEGLVTSLLRLITSSVKVLFPAYPFIFFTSSYCEYVQIGAITALACISGAAGNSFSPYYRAVIPLVMEIIRKATEPQDVPLSLSPYFFLYCRLSPFSCPQRQLRCRAIECVAILFVCVPKQDIINGTFSSFYFFLLSVSVLSETQMLAR